MTLRIRLLHFMLATAVAQFMLVQGLVGQGTTLHGRVMNTTSGIPIANANVSLLYARRVARTDSLGGFVLPSLREGTDLLVVQAVGFSPLRVSVSLSAGPPLEVDVDLEPLPPVLEKVVTEEDADGPRNIAMREFESRRAVALGRFVTRAELLRHRGRALDAVLRASVPGLRLLNEQGQTVAASGRDQSRSSPCYVNVVVDGMLRYGLGTRMPRFDLRSLEASMIAGLEYYTPASLPVEFNLRGAAPCGTLVIWLQN